MNQFTLIPNFGKGQSFVQILTKVFQLTIFIFLISQRQVSFGQSTAGTISFTASPGSTISGICGLDGLDVNTIYSSSAGNCNGESNCSGVNYLWQVNTGSGWGSASGTNTNATYNPPVATVRTQYRRAFTSPSTDKYSNVVVINPVLSTFGTIEWASGKSCIQAQTLTLNSSGLAGTALQWSWQTSTQTTNPSSNVCITCSNANSNDFFQVSGTGSGGNTAASWTFDVPSTTDVYCKRETYAVRTADSIKCYTTSAASEATFTSYRAGTDATRNVSSATTVNLRTELTNEDNGGTWTRIGTGAGTYTVNGDAASFSVVQGSSHMNTFRYTVGGTCCADTSYVYVNVTRSLNLETATFDVGLNAQEEAKLFLKADKVKFGGLFEIERKILGEITFSKVGQVDLSSSEQSEFLYLDKLPKSAKTAYYRIKNVDIDGKTHYTDVKQVTKKIKDLVDFYPSIVSQDMKLLVQNESDEANSVQVKIYDLVGRLLKSDNLDLHKGYNSLVLNLQSLHQDNYVLRVIDQTNRINETFRFVKRD